jgi:hypothetical protein
MQVIEIQTLVDITESKTIRPNQGSILEQGQYKNFVTLKQCLELRANIQYETPAQIEKKDIKDLGFGTKFKGKHNVWTFRFTPERTSAYATTDDEIGCLYDDINQVPVIKNLTETINIEKAIFELKDVAAKNTIVKALQGTI